VIPAGPHGGDGARLAAALGVDPAAVAASIAGFRPAPHRGEVVAEIDGVRFVDDSKATNVHAAVAAIRGVEDAVLIAGGRAKGMDLTPLRAEAGRLRAVVAIGESSGELVRVFDGVTPTTVAGSIEEAVREAFPAAGPGGTVLLAPACASWDQFRDYAERGDRFAAAARSLAREVTARG
jgi:UDP-N-acetylmuramoylalanine--D-glutamate ligase